MKRIRDKINEIAGFLDELGGIVPDELEEYRTNKEKKAACERYVERIVEGATDLAFLAIKSKRLKIPEDDVDAFNILLENEAIDEQA